MPRDPGTYCQFTNRPSTTLCQYNFAKVAQGVLRFCNETTCPLYVVTPTPVPGTVTK